MHIRKTPYTLFLILKDASNAIKYPKTIHFIINIMAMTFIIIFI